ncbi:MAG: hypothetical protein QXH37_08620, partial [Candidatus Bathyarchaeia archaeon]
MGEALDSRRDALGLVTTKNEFDGDSRASARRRKISVFIPVYKGSDLLEALLEELINCAYENKEIFVAMDEPDEKS